MNKVILLGCTPPPVGGIAKWTTRMLHAELPDNWNIVLVDEKLIERDVFGDNTRVNYLIEVKRWLNIWCDLFSRLFDKDVKIVHSCPIASRNSLLAENVNTIFAKMFNKKIVLHFRCTVPNMINTNIQKRLLKALCNRGDCIIALNTQTKKYLEEITKTKVVVLPNFIDETEIFNGDVTTREKLEIVLYTGGVTVEKGCLDIIEVSKYFSDITFKLVGEVNQEIKDKILGCNNVILTGVKSADEVKKELRECDLYMFLSHFPGEGFSNSLAEAMAVGKPCIVTDWAANADMVEDQKGGFVVKCGDVSEVISRMRLMLNDKLRHEQGVYNLNKARTQYRQSVVIREYVNIYNSLLEMELKN